MRWRANVFTSLAALERGEVIARVMEVDRSLTNARRSEGVRSVLDLFNSVRGTTLQAEPANGAPTRRCRPFFKHFLLSHSVWKCAGALLFGAALSCGAGQQAHTSSQEPKRRARAKAKSEFVYRSEPGMPEIPRVLSNLQLPFDVSGVLPKMAYASGRLFIVTHQEMLIHDGERVLHRVKLCENAVARLEIPTPQGKRGIFFYETVYADSQGAIAFGSNDRGNPVLAKVTPDGKLSCETRLGERLLAEPHADALGIWQVERKGRVELRTARGAVLPALPRGVPAKAKVFAPSKNAVWLETPGHWAKPRWFFDGQSWRCDRQFPEQGITAMAKSQDGRVWALLSDRRSDRKKRHFLGVWNGAAWKMESFGHAMGLAVRRDDVWLAVRHGLWLRQGSNWFVFRQLGTVNVEIPRQAPIIDCEGRVFFIDLPSARSPWLLRRFDPPAKTNL